MVPTTRPLRPSYSAPDVSSSSSGKVLMAIPSRGAGEPLLLPVFQKFLDRMGHRCLAVVENRGIAIGLEGGGGGVGGRSTGKRVWVTRTVDTLKTFRCRYRSSLRFLGDHLNDGHSRSFDAVRNLFTPFESVSHTQSIHFVIQAIGTFTNDELRHYTAPCIDLFA